MKKKLGEGFKKYIMQHYFSFLPFFIMGISNIYTKSKEKEDKMNSCYGMNVWVSPA